MIHDAVRVISIRRLQFMGIEDERMRRRARVVVVSKGVRVWKRLPELNEQESEKQHESLPHLHASIITHFGQAYQDRRAEREGFES